MLTNKLKQNIIGNTTIGLQINIADDGSISCSYVLMRKDKSSLIIEEKEMNIDLDSFCKKFTQKHPIFINIDGKGIISKTSSYDKDDEDDYNSLIHNVIPNAKIEDFYFQHIPTSETEIIISVARKDLVDNIITEIEKSKCFIYNITLGFICINTLNGILDEETVSIPNWEIQKSENGIISYTKKQDSSVSFYSIGEEKIEASYVLPYASALSFYTGNTSLGNISTVNYSKADDFFYLNAIKKGGIAVISLVLLLLVINYLLFDNFYNKRQALEKESMQNEMLLKKLERLQTQLDKKKKVLSTVGNTGFTKFSFYADRIAMSVPTKMKLSQINLAPLSRRIKQEKAIKYDTEKIDIAGTVSTSTILYDWIELLRDESWVEKVVISNYSHNTEKNIGEFQLKLIIENKNSVE